MHRGRRVSRFVVGALLLLSCLLTMPVSAQNGPLWWAEDLNAAGGQEVNVIRGPSEITLGTEELSPASANVQQRSGQYTFPVQTLDRPVNSIRARITATIPPGAEVLVEARVRSLNDRWTEWLEANEAAPAQFALAGADVQVRISLHDDGQGHGPSLQRLEMAADTIAGIAAGPAATLSARTYRVYATREGLVGERTANGHVIVPNDRFVALPSRRALAANGGHEYQVRVCYPKTGRCITAPVWDVGPWNTKDDYWNPSSIRQMWKDLPQGKPEAQAAFQDGYNGGRDQYGRRVANPAGIDLADGTFKLDLGMTDNDWVQVTYLWTGDNPRSWPLVQRRQTGERVKTVQYLLRAHSYTLAVDGDFGPATETAVNRFQSAKGLTADGIVGPNTWEALIITTRRGDTGDAVRAVQSQLAAKGYALAVDGAFGDMTEAAVRRFQSAAGLTSDGIVGPNTWSALVQG